MQLSSKFIAVSIFSVLWSMLIVMNKFVLNLDANPILYLMYYQGIASIILFSYSFDLKKQKMEKLKREDILKIILLGFGVSVAIVISTIGLKLSTSINYSFIIKSGVVFGPLSAFFFLNERLSKVKIVLMPIFLLGVYLISTDGQAIIPERGDVLILISASIFSLTDILMKKLTNTIQSDIVAALRGLSVTFFLFVFSLIFVGSLSPNISPLYIIISGILAATTQFFLLKTISLSSVSYLSMMTMAAPVIVSVIGFFFMKEPFTIMHVIGGAVIIVSGLLVEKYKI